MYALLKKEIASFFGSLAGYVVIFVFLLATSLFLWVFPGNYNIPESGYASLDGLFSLAPWVYLFLVPAVTMRFFAEEKRLGTMEVLLTRPLSAFQIVFAKFLAGLILVTISLLPTLIYFYSVYLMGNPIGCIDTGGTWGAYISLFFLAAIYVAIGLLASALTDNQIFAFILALFLSFLAYMGFSLVGSMEFSSGIQQFLINLGIDEHYASVSRGVVDSRDVTYFMLAIFLFLFITSRIIHFHRIDRKHELKTGARMLVLFLVIALLSGSFFIRIDLTAEKRFSLSPVSKELVGKLERPVHITLYLDGELPAGLVKLKKSIEEKIGDYNAYASERIDLEFFDPYSMTDAKKREALFNTLIYKGIQPTQINQNTDRGTNTRLIFPGAIIKYGDKEKSVNLLKNNPVQSAEVNLNNSVETLEFELSNALAGVMSEERQIVAFLSGQGELNEYETHDIRLTLSEEYQVEDVVPDDLAARVPVKVLIVANPTQKFTEAAKYQIDQYLMRGGRIMWLIDPVSVSLDSLSNGYMTLAFPQNLNLDDQLFRYGFRLNSNLIQDAECLLIPVNRAPVGSPPKFEPAPWYYSPLLLPSGSSVISRNLNRVKAEFVSSIDTVGKQDGVHKSVLLTTSDHSLVAQAPVEVSLESVNNPPDQRLFSQPSQVVGLLLEGKFSSVFKNRMVESFGGRSSAIKDESEPTRMIVFSDGNLIANQYSLKGNAPDFMPLGFDRYSRQTFGNKDLILNAVNYLCDDQGLMELRSKVFKIRLLDKVRLKQSKFGWQLFNVLAPLIFISALGGIYVVVRRRKFRK